MPPAKDPQNRPSIETAGAAAIDGNVSVSGDFVARDKVTNIIVDGQPVALPSRLQLLTYADAVQQRFARWADQPDAADAPLYDQASDPRHSPDSYIDTQARALPMRVSPFRQGMDGREADAQDLVHALQEQPRALILGEPGSGKTTALERLAWVTATQTLALPDEDDRLSVPIFVRLADYRSEPDLVPLIQTALTRLAVLDVNLASLRQLLRVRNVRFVLLLDGLNELDWEIRTTLERRMTDHAESYPAHTLFVTCRTADFSLDQQADAPTQLIPGASIWQVQPLVDTIRYWDDPSGHSDLRTYLHRHLGNTAGKRLYERLRSDVRMYDLAHLPLFLWMFKETAGDGQGELPPDRGRLLQRFVRAPRLLERIPRSLRTSAERSLEALTWRAQQARRQDLDEDELYAELEAVRGQRSYDLDALRQHLHEAGLLIDVGNGRYSFLHQLIQEYAAAAHLTRLDDCASQIPNLAQHEWWRECIILALWLRSDLHTPAYLLRLMNDPAVDLRVRVAAATILARVGDPRFPIQTAPASAPSRSVTGVERTDRIRYIEPQMVPIPAGEAILGGDDPDANDDEKPECTVPVAAFELAVYPVTNAEYACFLDAGGYDDASLWTPAGQAWLRGESKLDAQTENQYRAIHRFLCADLEGALANFKQTQAITDELEDAYRQIAAEWSEDDFVDAYARQILGEERREPVWWRDSRFNAPTQPVVGVNWYEAMAYAVWLARVTGKGYCLPSEAQWEWAARRRSPTAPGRRYPWGDTWDSDRCNSRASGLNAPSPVGVYPQGATSDGGLHDLAGNVYEWTRSLYAPYPYDAARCEDPNADGLRVCRGGSWYVGGDRVRCAFRYWNDSGDRNFNLGYRLARLLSL